MINRSSGRIDWTALAVLAACLAAVASTITAFSTMRLVREEAAQARMRAGLESLWHLSSEWDGASMLEARGSAAAALLAGRPSDDIDAVLGFFDEVALLVERGVLDPELVWYEFYWPMANYWFGSQEYVRRVQAEDPGTWEPLARILPRLLEIEGKRRSHVTDGAVPTKSQIAEFLTAEVGAGECAEDDDVQRTPL